MLKKEKTNLSLHPRPSKPQARRPTPRLGRVGAPGAYKQAAGHCVRTRRTRRRTRNGGAPGIPARPRTFPAAESHAEGALRARARRRAVGRGRSRGGRARRRSQLGRAAEAFRLCQAGEGVGIPAAEGVGGRGLRAVACGGGVVRGRRNGSASVRRPRERQEAAREGKVRANGISAACAFSRKSRFSFGGRTSMTSGSHLYLPKA